MLKKTPKSLAPLKNLIKKELKKCPVGINNQRNVYPKD